jgi:DNA-binding transcriptional LysR family regulator
VVIDNAGNLRRSCLVEAIPFPQLQSFLAVARTGGFSAAARELAVSRSAVSQAVRQLEEQLGVVLVARTTRSVSLTEAGRRLVETTSPAIAQTRAALAEISAKPGEVTGRLRVTVPPSAYFALGPYLKTFRARQPRIEVELVFEDRQVDIIAEGYDAGIRLSEYVERDMVSIRLTEPFNFIVVGAPNYLRTRGTPERPEDLTHHECLTFRSATNGSLYAWELERGKRTWRVPARGGLLVNDGMYCVKWAEEGLGLAYAMEPLVAEALQAGRLVQVLEAYSSAVPGFYLYYPTRAQRSGPLQLFVETIQQLKGQQYAKKKK